jgi:hypothetical protein
MRTPKLAMASPFSWPVLVPSVPRAPAPVNLGVVRLERSLANKIPNSVIGTAASVIGAYYYSHSTLNSLFMESGAPGDAPVGNCETKCSLWLKRCNEDPSVDALAVLGQVIQKFMDQEPSDL